MPAWHPISSWTFLNHEPQACQGQFYICLIGLSLGSSLKINSNVAPSYSCIIARKLSGLSLTRAKQRPPLLQKDQKRQHFATQRVWGKSWRAKSPKLKLLLSLFWKNRWTGLERNWLNEDQLSPRPSAELCSTILSELVQCPVDVRTVQCTKHKSIAGDRLDCGARISLDTFVDSCTTLCEAAAFTISCQLNWYHPCLQEHTTGGPLPKIHFTIICRSCVTIQLQDLKSNLGLW